MSSYNEFKISYIDGKYEFNVSGSQLKRFLADAFGQSSYDSLKYDEDYGFNQATATAEQVMQYLKDSFYIDESYDEQTAYDIVVIRYAMKSTTWFKSALKAKCYGMNTVTFDVFNLKVNNSHFENLGCGGIAVGYISILAY